MRLGRDWALVAVGVVLAAAVFLFRGEVSAGRFIITVVPADRSELSCSMPAGTGRLQCGFDAHGRARTEGPPDERVLHPYVTTSGEVVLLAGVFEQPDVQAWTETALRARTAERVTLGCVGKLAGMSGHVFVRWSSAGRWDSLDDLQIASIASCAFLQ